ncbi:rhodanese-like domain-containing protein [Auraticoccus sp. F435]|uniref:Rhodanese-like domain-containing protein n=1 Tax=Auraticoccus cholistanensis TaxID=2656650 RepID=A0A6A9UVE0_9ACTN|nr:rhodanese-like domain-containing protein [Auraticoccus cholistanensis]MVA76926.1 rhodanese-like domain-containing protein [Auraticoccus cholistanensis]
MDVPTVTIDQIPDDAHLVDVREADEWAAGHAERAQHLPLTELTARLDELPADDEVYLICRSGGRSARAAAWLNQNGFSAVNVAGGMGEWQERGLPLVGEGGSPYVM